MSTTSTTTDRAEINRRNAQKSTGPRTAEGKDRSRFNAVKHGLNAKTLVLPGEDADALQRRSEAWTADLAPRNDVEQYLVDRAVQVSWQLDRADRVEVARLASVIREAPEEEARRQQEEALVLGRRLFWDRRGPMELYPHFPLRDQLLAERKPRTSFSGLADDPDDPARLVLQLESTAAGCGWLLDRWAELRELLEEDLLWQSVDRFKAIRLLGKQPMDAADDPNVTVIYQSCWVLNPRVRELDAFEDVWNELLAGEANLFRQRLADRAVEEFLPADQDEAKAKLLGIMGEVTDRLKSLARSHQERADADQAEETARLSFDDSKEGERLRRFQFACGRSLHKTLDTLLKLRRADEKQKPGPIPAAPTVPAESESVAETSASIPFGEDDAPAPVDLATETRPEPLAGSEHPSSKNEPTATTTEHRNSRNGPTVGLAEVARSVPGATSRKAYGAARSEKENSRRIMMQCHAIS
jgi:hypothetical protein